MSRAVSPALGTVLLLAVTLVVVTAVGTVALGTADPPDPASHVVVAAEADAATGWITLVHESGPEVDVREVELRVTVDGRPLKHQPPVPFRGAEGFWGAPTGPFNSATDPVWELGERTSFRLAGTNEPELVPGAVVRVEVYEGDLPVATAETTAR